MKPHLFIKGDGNILNMDSILGQEPDLGTNVFVLLPVSDICQAELVCTSWRGFIVEHKIWKHKLLRKWNSNPFWKDCLQQHHWNTQCESSHEINKRLTLEIAISIPENLTDIVLQAVKKESNLNDTKFTKSNVNSIEHSFLNRLYYDRRRIISKMPKRPWGRIGWRRGPRKIKFDINPDSNSDDITAFSKLLLFSPSAFPILVSKINRNDVILAGTRYGKGRIIVASHHNLLNDDALMQVPDLSKSCV